MLPKVATQILHSTSRAAATIHQQTHTIRNVLQLQSSGPSGSGSGRGGNGPGTGSAKHNAGSRFYSGYNGAGRAVTHANALTSHNDGSFDDNDNELAVIVRPRPREASKQKRGNGRLRSSSLSQSPADRTERGEKLGVLKTVQLHTRSRHVFTHAIEDASPLAEVDALPVLDRELQKVELEEPARHVLVRRNSTSSSDGLDAHSPASPIGSIRRNSTASVHSTASASASTPPPPLPPAPIRKRKRSSSAPTDPASPQSLTPPDIGAIPPAPDVEQHLPGGSPHYNLLARARATRDSSAVAEAVLHFRRTCPDPSVREFNLALLSLHETRVPGEPLTLLLETYNDMLARSLVPNMGTYMSLLEALTARDFELFRLATVLTRRTQRSGLLKSLTGAQGEERTLGSDKARLEAIKEETNFPSAMAVFESMLARGMNFRLPVAAYATLLRSCAVHGDITNAIHVFAALERRADIRPPAFAYRSLLQAYTNGGDAAGAEQVWAEYRRAATEGRIEWEVSLREWDTGVYDVQTRADVRRPAAADLQTYRTIWARRTHLQVWNQMIETYFRAGRPEAAVALLEEMLAAPPDVVHPAEHEDAGGAEKEKELAQNPFLYPPAPASSTFTATIAGFVAMGDLDTALVWFDRLLAQDARGADPWASLRTPVRPDTVAWLVMLDALALAGRVDDLNKLFKVLLKDGPSDDVELRPVDCAVVLAANLQALEKKFASLTNASEEKTERQSAEEVLEWLAREVLMGTKAALHGSIRWRAIRDLVRAYFERGLYAKGTDTLARVLAADRAAALPDSTTPSTTVDPVNFSVSMGQQRLVQVLLADAYHTARARGPALDYPTARALARLAEEYNVRPEGHRAPVFLHAYGLARENALPSDMRTGDWNALLDAAVYLDMMAASEGPGAEWMAPSPAGTENAFPGLKVLLEDMHKEGGNEVFGRVDGDLLVRAIKVLASQLGQEELKAFAERMGPVFKQVVEKQAEADYVALQEALRAAEQEGKGKAQIGLEETLDLEDPVEKYKNVEIDWGVTRALESQLSLMTDQAQNVAVAFTRFQQALKRDKAPALPVLARFIEQLGRVGRLPDVRVVYQIAQALLVRPEMEEHNETQAQMWVRIEDAMIIAFAHAGDLDSAHVHRCRILEQGRAPSADAYGALILYVKDTTDDTSNALALFQEAQANEVVPNLYLYNNIISKLAKARKADYALELFQQMRAQKLMPSSITYGAVIGACARVGDVASAEYLFEEMTRAKNFKPRVPPYNTMMQLYTTTKPNRERAVHYYNELLKAKVHPSAHTYKLLLDTYGSNDPVDIESMERVFAELQKNYHIPIQGTHIASLINAYGCVQKDLEKAIAVFDAVPTYRGSPTRDALVFEAMFNVLVAHRRSDLIVHFVRAMSESGVHMTAYIANLMIKLHAVVGNLEEARTVFESLRDPPVGVAAPNNHAPHDPASSPAVDLMEPVYREPSTWETMVRSELGSGNRDRAEALLERLKARGYPEAVYNRISGILVDHSMVLS